VAEDIGGIKDAGPWIEKANPDYTVLVDEKHTVATLYGMVNVPTGVWIDENGKMVRPNEVAPQNLLADANFKMGQYLVSAGHAREAIDYFKTAQSLRPDDWNYKRNAWLFANPDKDYGTNFGKEVKALNGKPYYPAPDLPKAPSSLPKGPSSSPRPPE
jgi:hypothetical protein